MIYHSFLVNCPHILLDFIKIIDKTCAVYASFFVSLGMMAAAAGTLAAHVVFPGTDPGKAYAMVDSTQATIGNTLMPINSIMTHGLIITKNGPPRCMSKEPENCIKEMRAAFGCGSSLMELYVDGDLMSQKNGRLWDELAACIKWSRRNEDVLADVHWVGGNPWNGKDGAIYGWAAWNKAKCTLTLRNSSQTEKTLSTTLREILDIPPTWKGYVKLTSSFTDQRPLDGITDEGIDVDTPINFIIKPFEVIVMEGRNTENEAG